MIHFCRVQDTALDNFKYLGAWIDETANDVKVRKALA